MQSPQPSTERSRVVILGNDALIAARPATPIQLARACMAAGFAFVAPSSWGDELIAQHAGDHMAASPSGASLLLHCPYVLSSTAAENSPAMRRCLSVSPPVAAARYVRAGFAPHEISVTYVGACPGGRSEEIDEQVTPEAFVSRLHKAGHSPLLEPDHFDDILPADRSRFASKPGGAPNPEWLLARANAILRDVAPETAVTVARAVGPDERYLLDLADAAGCRCAHEAAAVQRLEPARASSPVVSTELAVDLAPLASPPQSEPRAQMNQPGPSGPAGATPAGVDAADDAAAYWVFDDPVAPQSSGATLGASPSDATPSAWWPSEALSGGVPTPPPEHSLEPREGSRPPFDPPRLTILPDSSGTERTDASGAARDARPRVPRLPPARTRVRAEAGGTAGASQAEAAASSTPHAPRPFMRRPVDVRASVPPEQQASARLGQRLPGRSRSQLLTQSPPVTTSDSEHSTTGERKT
ncbi:MAG: hypothetical protein U0132_11265 [Gemmatimonadaceae bacterium]